MDLVKISGKEDSKINTYLFRACVPYENFHFQLSLVYFLLSTTIVILWAFDRMPGYAGVKVLRKCVLVFCGCHVAVIYLYQMPTMRSFCNPQSTIARIFGLVYLKVSECDPKPLVRVTPYWPIPQILSPFIFVLLYLLIAIQLRVLKDPKESSDRAMRSPREKTLLFAPTQVHALETVRDKVKLVFILHFSLL
ncbi:unnamed protein product [Anisakis simplex]|uniref:Acyl_transf_3 domain-containing protein n=1 Tax=Anisakis simplex TaxID=6269 RepID=A0A0M3J6J9_ANISI|nr:unnamed protein product [Anisakis simplex]